MIDFFEIVERAETGPKMDEKDWDMGFFKKIQELVKEYGLSKEKEKGIFNMDDDLADSAFEAAVKFLTDMGIYCIDTQRIIKLEEEEIKKAIREMPSEITVGEGRDARKIQKREIEDRRPVSSMAVLHTPYSEDLCWLIPENFARIHRLDIIEGFITPTVNGVEVYTPPIEAYAALRQLAWMREGIKKAGRPGMAITYYPVSTKASTLIAPIDPYNGLRRTDGVLLTTLPNNKIEYGYLTAAIVYENYGCYKVNGGSEAYAGGFCGGPDGAIVETIVKVLSGWIIYHNQISETGVYDFRHVTGKARVLHSFEDSIAHQALCRNTNAIRTAAINCVFELGSEMYLWEIAAQAIKNTLNGANFTTLNTKSGLRAKVGKIPGIDAMQTPLDVEFAIEVSDAVLNSGIKREDGAEIVQKIEEKLANKQWGEYKTIRECYDLVKHKSSQEYENKYYKVKKDLIDLGLEFE